MGILSFLADRAQESTSRQSSRPPPDQHGQAPLAAYRSEAVIDRQIDELIGLAKGVIADGHVSRGEAEFLLRWLETNRAASKLWPASVLYPQFVKALADGALDDEEEGELLELILKCVGGNAPARGEASMSTALPLTRPAPNIEFAEHAFCFTGKFYSGTRAWCEDQVTSRGAHTCTITKDLNYLVIGEIGSRDWIHSTHGRKIDKAVAYNDSGCAIAIVAEQHWHSALG